MISTRSIVTAIFVAMMWYALNKTGHPVAAAYMAGVGTGLIYIVNHLSFGKNDDGDDGGWDDWDDEGGPHPIDPYGEETRRAITILEEDLRKASEVSRNG